MYCYHMDCSICLSPLKKKTYKLSCGHEFHLKCYQNCVYSNNCNIFIKCPLCRELNINTEKPYDNSYDNLKIWTSLERCKCTTKSGKRCKKRAILLNNGKCSIHQKPLSKDKYKEEWRENRTIMRKRRRTIHRTSMRKIKIP